MIEICESITEDDLETEIETDICSIVVKKYPLDEESEYKCTVWGNDDDDSTVSDLHIHEFVFFAKTKFNRYHCDRRHFIPTSPIVLDFCTI